MSFWAWAKENVPSQRNSRIIIENGFFMESYRMYW